MLGHGRATWCIWTTIQSVAMCVCLGMSICMIFVVWGAIPILISCIGILVSFCHKCNVSWLDDYTNIDKINVFQKIKVRKSSPLLWRILHKTMQHSLHMPRTVAFTPEKWAIWADSTFEIYRFKRTFWHKDQNRIYCRFWEKIILWFIAITLKIRFESLLATQMDDLRNFCV